MRLVVMSLGAWCLVSVPAGLVLGRLMRARGVRHRECPPDARDLITAADDDARTLAAR